MCFLFKMAPLLAESTDPNARAPLGLPGYARGRWKLAPASEQPPPPLLPKYYFYFVYGRRAPAEVPFDLMRHAVNLPPAPFAWPWGAETGREVLMRRSQVASRLRSLRLVALALEVAWRSKTPPGR